MPTARVQSESASPLGRTTSGTSKLGRSGLYSFRAMVHFPSAALGELLGAGVSLRLDPWATARWARPSSHPLPRGLAFPDPTHHLLRTSCLR